MISIQTAECLLVLCLVLFSSQLLFSLYNVRSNSVVSLIRWALTCSDQLMSLPVHNHSRTSLLTRGELHSFSNLPTDGFLTTACVREQLMSGLIIIIIIIIMSTAIRDKLKNRDKQYSVVDTLVSPAPWIMPAPCDKPHP